MKNFDLKAKFNKIEALFQSGEIDLYQYIDLMHSFNKMLLSFSKKISKSDIKKIEITSSGVTFEFTPLGIRLKTDGAARSAPFEVLNFGQYEADDAWIFFGLIHKKKTIFDIGANIGWYSINLALREPDATIYSFEPIPRTFELLQFNLKLNCIENVKTYNCGISNKNSKVDFFFFKGGSAIASIKNLIDHKKVQQIRCKVETLDDFCFREKILNLDIIKCDVEGSELFVLEGGIKTITNFLPIIFIEVVNEWCQRCGYTAFDIFNFLFKYGYKSFRSCERGLREIKSPILKDDGKYNYFFIHPKKHKAELAKIN